MSDVLPAPFLFHFALPVPRVERDADLLEACHPWPDVAALGRDGKAEERSEFGRIAVGWNETGLGVAVEVTGKRHPLVYDPLEPWVSDGLSLWIDTRNTRNVHRATRFCHQFCLIPGAVAEGEPPVVQLPVPRAKEDAPTAGPGDVSVTIDVRDDGYRLDAWFATASLHGFDPESSPRLGGYYHLKDAELGDRYTVVGPEFPFSGDPSLWVTLELLD